MKYLNKIIFINTAGKSLKYAEVNLDNNVHFVGKFIYLCHITSTSNCKQSDKN